MDHSSEAASIKKEPVKLSVLLNLSAITLTCFVTRELKPCQDLVILPALNTDGRASCKSATPKSVFPVFLCTAGGTGWLPYTSLTHHRVSVMVQGLSEQTGIICHHRNQLTNTVKGGAVTGTGCSLKSSFCLLCFFYLLFFYGLQSTNVFFLFKKCTTWGVTILSHYYSYHIVCPLQFHSIRSTMRACRSVPPLLPSHQGLEC